MPKSKFPIRVKVLLTVLVLIMLVMSMNTSTMANLFRKDKTTYIRDLSAVMAVHLAEETNALLRNYTANIRAFGDVIYDAELAADTKQDVLQNLFRNYEDIVAITAVRGAAEPVTAYDTRALETLGLDRAALLDHRDRHPLPARLDKGFDLRMERIGDQELVRLIVDVPATATTEAYRLAANVQPDRLIAVTERSRGFRAVIFDRDGRPVFSAAGDGDAVDAQWAGVIKESAGAAMSTAVEFVSDGVPMLGAYAPLASGALWATVQIPTSVVYLTARELLSDLVIAALILFAVASAVSMVFARRLSRPLERLTDAAQQVGKGDFEVNVDAESRDEIGVLGHSFNEMTRELRERETKLASANAALVQSEKLAAFGQLGAGIAHEVKNPLAGILGYAQLTLRKLDEDSPFRKNLKIIETETRRCTEIISNLLRFARQESAEMGPTDINAVVEAAMQIVDHQLGVNNVDVRTELAPDLPTCNGNANQLQQTIINFAINAQQAMGEDGGSFTVRTRCDAGHAVVIELEDNGPGIPEDIRSKIFEPFFTTKAAGQGTGLGLSVTYGIIKDHGGSIRIEDPEGGGTRFVVSLPVPQAKAA